nr:hypothetical protein 495p2_00001 [Serratia proteamaculans]
MKKILLTTTASLACLLYVPVSPAVMFPVVVDPKVIDVIAWGNHDSVFTSSGSILVDQQPRTLPVYGSGLDLIPISVHCAYGYPAIGQPASECDWRGGEHAPKMVSECRLASYDSWELTPSSTCQTTTNWGPHRGAGPGAECTLFVQSTTPSYVKSITTISGILDATMVANSGSSFCQKPLPPEARCDLVLPPDIDHGSIAPNARSTASIDGTIDCGATPKVTFMGGATLTLSPGIKTTLTSQLIGTTQVRITSTLDAINGAPGNHSASTVVIVSPN